MYEKFHILTKRELEARAEVFYETYSKTLNIEAGTMIDMVTKKIIPAVIKYENNLAASVNTIKSAYAAANISTQEGMLHEIAELLGETYKALKKLSDVHAKAVAMEGKEQAFYYKDVVKEAMDELRAPVDKLEVLVERKVWPMQHMAIFCLKSKNKSDCECASEYLIKYKRMHSCPKILRTAIFFT